MRIPRGYVTTAEPAGVATGAPPLRKEVVEADDPAPYAFAAARVHARMPRSPTLDTAHRQAISSWQNGAAPVEASKSGRDERGLAYVGICVFLWFSASAICFNTTKQLHMHWSVLTLAQLTVSSLLGAVALLCKMFPYQPITSSSQLHATVSLAAVFTGGFVTLNMALGLMHVSLVSSLRACEPAFTLLLAPFLVRVERMTWRTLSTMAIIVTGCLLSVAGNVELDASGLAVMLVCNGLWALRAVLTKRLQRSIAVLDPASLFVHISCFGALLQCLVVLVCWLSSSAGLGAGGAGFRWGLGGGSDRWSEHRVLLVNVVSFHAYQLMSSLVLARVPLMTHAVINAMRLPFISFAGWLEFRNPMTIWNVLGVLLASAATPLFHVARIADTVPVHST